MSGKTDGGDSLSEALAHDTEDTLKLYLFGDEPEKASGSKQLQEDDLGWEGVTNCVMPPYDPSLWAYLLEQNTRLASCINTFAKNTVGFGWEIVPKEEVTEQTSPEVLAEIAEETARLTVFFMSPNDEMPTATLMKLMKIDEEATGNGYIEVWRDVDNVPKGMAHVPSHTVRVLKNKEGFVQTRAAKRVYFKNFGDPRVMNSETGEFLTDEHGAWLDESKAISFAQRANEMIHFLIYSPRSSYYGIPRYVAASPAISGNRLAAMRNVNFFDNDAVPRMLITVSGGELTAKTMNDLKQFFRKEARGVFNAHRVAVLQAEKKQVSMQKDGGVKIEVHPLTVGKVDDASFQQYRKGNDAEVREAFGIAEIFLGTSEDVNRATAIVSQTTTNEQVFEPDRVEKEYRINHTLVKAFGARRVKFQFLRPKLSNVAEDAAAAKDYGTAGGLTLNDIRRKVIGKPYPKEFSVYADLPIPMALARFQADLQREVQGGKVASVLKFVDELRELKDSIREVETARRMKEAEDSGQRQV